MLIVVLLLRGDSFDGSPRVVCTGLDGIGVLVSEAADEPLRPGDPREPGRGARRRRPVPHVRHLPHPGRRAPRAASRPPRRAVAGQVRPARARRGSRRDHPPRGGPPVGGRGAGRRPHCDPRRRRHRRGRQARRGRRTPLHGLDRAHRRRPPARCRLQHRHRRSPRATGHRAAARRRHVGGDGDRQERDGVLTRSRTPSATATVDKVYHALVQGHPDPLEGTIDAPIGRHATSDWKFAVREDGKHSVTHYETLEAHRFASLLEIHLETGRTHQIRVHMAALRHPCVGDLTYGADPTLGRRARPRPAVAARRPTRVRASRHRGAGRVRVAVPRRPGPRARGHPWSH